MAVPDLTTADKLHVRLSTPGVVLRSDHLPFGAVDDAISQASSEAATFLGRYPMTTAGGVPGLDSSEVVANWVADLALYHLCRVRANPVPASVKERYEQVLEWLALVLAGKMTIPDLDNAGGKPSVVNHQINYDNYPSLRRAGLRSYPRRPGGGYPSYHDYREPPSYPGG